MPDRRSFLKGVLVLQQAHRTLLQFEAFAGQNLSSRYSLMIVCMQLYCVEPNLRICKVTRQGLVTMYFRAHLAV